MGKDNSSTLTRVSTILKMVGDDSAIDDVMAGKKRIILVDCFLQPLTIFNVEGGTMFLQQAFENTKCIQTLQSFNLFLKESVSHDRVRVLSTDLGHLDLKERMKCSHFVSDLRDASIFGSVDACLVYILALILKQSIGQYGSLLKDGTSNIFPMKNLGGSTHTVTVRWSDGNKKWHLLHSSNDHWLNAEERIFCVSAH